MPSCPGRYAPPPAQENEPPDPAMYTKTIGIIPNGPGFPPERPAFTHRRAVAMLIAVVTGNPKPASRTHGVALAVADTLSAALTPPLSAALTQPLAAPPASRPGTPARLVIDLAEYASTLFDPSDAELTRLTAEVAAADVAIFASPTYKAAYTGMLKAFLDRYGSNGLAATVAVPVMTGGWPGHLLAVEVHLRPVLVELGATVPARGLYVTEPEFVHLDAAVAKWAETALPPIRRALTEPPLP
jgi:FMN reductase